MDFSFGLALRHASQNLSLLLETPTPRFVSPRSARKLGGAIRYRMDQQADNASDDTTNDNTSPPLASQHGSEEECDEEETEANLSGGGVFFR